MAKEAEGRRFLDTIKAIGQIAGLLTSIAAIFAVVGYVIILSFSQTLNIYGPATFDTHLPYEAVFDWLYKTVKFAGGNPVNGILTLISFLSFGTLGMIPLNKLTPKWRLKWKSLFWGLSMITLIMMVWIVGNYELGDKSAFAKIVLNSLAIPILAGLVLFIVTNFHRAHSLNAKGEPSEFPSIMLTLFQRWGILLRARLGKRGKGTTTYPGAEDGKSPLNATFRRAHYEAIALAVSILFVAPFLYGTVIYDLPVTGIEEISCSDSLNTLAGMKEFTENPLASVYLARTGNKALLIRRDYDKQQARIALVNDKDIKYLELGAILPLGDNKGEPAANYLRLFFGVVDLGVDKYQSQAKLDRDSNTVVDSTITWPEG